MCAEAGTGGCTCVWKVTSWAQRPEKRRVGCDANHSGLYPASINMATLMAPGPTRPLPARLQRFGSAEDMRKEASFPAPESLAQSSATPSPTPKPQRASVSRPHGVVPTLQNMCISIVQEGVLSGAYKCLDVPQDVLAELASRLQSKKLLSDENVFLFASLTELVLSNCPISDKGLRALFEQPESKEVRAKIEAPKGPVCVWGWRAGRQRRQRNGGGRRSKKKKRRLAPSPKTSLAGGRALCLWRHPLRATSAAHFSLFGFRFAPCGSMLHYSPLFWLKRTNRHCCYHFAGF